MLGAIGTAVGGALGGPVGASIGGALGGAIGSYRTGSAQRRAYDAQIQAEREAREAAQEAAKFRAVGFTSPYGKARYEVGDDGMLSGAYFDLDPRFQERADRYAELGTTALSSLNTDPRAAAEERTQRLLEFLRPERELGSERMFSSLASKGLTGIGADLGTGAYVNPIAAARQEAIARQDADIANRSYDVARSDIRSDMSMIRSLFQDEAGIYDLGRNELEYGLGLADDERVRRLEAAGADAKFGRSIADIGGQRDVFSREREEALFSSADDLYRRYSQGGQGLFTGGSNPSFGNSLQDPGLYYS